MDSHDPYRFFIFVVLMAWWADWPPVATGEVTIYQEQCSHEDGRCKFKEYFFNRTTYRASKENNTVTMWSDTFQEPRLFRNCAIRDKENFACENEANDQFGFVPVMTNGGVRSAGLILQKTDAGISRFKYWYFKLRAWATPLAER